MNKAHIKRDQKHFEQKLYDIMYTGEIAVSAQCLEMHEFVHLLSF